jgi:Glyoxalase-like domain
MALTIDLTLDCANPTGLAEFWKLALGYVDEPPPPPFATRREWLTHHDVPEDEWDRGAWLCDPAGVGPRLALQGVREPKVAKNRLHIDVRVAGDGDVDERWARITEMADRLTAAGATTLEQFAGHHVTMADPEGNEFCVC